MRKNYTVRLSNSFYLFIDAGLGMLEAVQCHCRTLLVGQHDFAFS
jgi:hypothetical protein